MSFQWLHVAQSPSPSFSSVLAQHPQQRSDRRQSAPTGLGTLPGIECAAQRGEAFQNEAFPGQPPTQIMLGGWAVDWGWIIQSGTLQKWTSPKVILLPRKGAEQQMDLCVCLKTAFFCTIMYPPKMNKPVESSGFRAPLLHCSTEQGAGSS